VAAMLCRCSFPPRRPGVKPGGVRWRRSCGPGPYGP
jgi:hypothetical protein